MYSPYFLHRVFLFLRLYDIKRDDTLHSFRELAKAGMLLLFGYAETNSNGMLKWIGISFASSTSTQLVSDTGKVSQHVPDILTGRYLHLLVVLYC